MEFPVGLCSIGGISLELHVCLWVGVCWGFFAKTLVALTFTFHLLENISVISHFKMF